MSCGSFEKAGFGPSDREVLKLVCLRFSSEHDFEYNSFHARDVLREVRNSKIAPDRLVEIYTGCFAGC